MVTPIVMLLSPQYLLIRIPVQIMILLWVYRLAIRPPKPAREVGLASR
jgi:hypothetical protein